MASLFDIDKSLIKAVDDETARELVARLCRAELRAQGLPGSAVISGGDQRAVDGGVDVRVDCSLPLVSPDYIPSQFTAIQVIRIFVRRFFPQTWCGALSSVLEARLPLFDLLVVRDSKDVFSEVEAEKASFEKRIAEERKCDKRTERSRDSSFE